MADSEISELAAAGALAPGHLLAVVDVSDAAASPDGTTKRTTVASIAALVEVEAASASDLSTPRVLRLEGGAHVDHGKFWNKGETDTSDIGTFMWDAWVIYRGGEYLISDGYGGAHALLW